MKIHYSYLHNTLNVFIHTIFAHYRRWEVWRKYEHFCKVYDNLCTKYTNHKIAKLPTLESIKQTWRQMSSNAGMFCIFACMFSIVYEWSGLTNDPVILCATNTLALFLLLFKNFFSLKQPTTLYVLCSIGESGETFGGEEEVPDDDTIFLGHSFLQKLQVSVFCTFLWSFLWEFIVVCVFAHCYVAFSLYLVSVVDPCE